MTECASSDLREVRDSDGRLPECTVQSIACQLVSALYYLHLRRILHRDMKQENVLVFKGGIVKLCDFGFSRQMSNETLILTSMKGTPLFMSPEIMYEKGYDHTADLWALGCILYELYTGMPPFFGSSVLEVAQKVKNMEPVWPEDMSDTCRDFLQGLLTKNPDHRLQWPALLEHPFVAHAVKGRFSLRASNIKKIKKHL